VIRFGDLDSLARRFRAARPFAHVVIDRALDPDRHARIAAAFEKEPQALVEDEIYLHLRSTEPPQSEPLREFCAALQAACGAVSAICGRPLSRADGAAYTYLRGHYLLPHSDWRASEGRAIAYAYYVVAPARGGELELFDCRERAGEIVRARPARRIAARANRLVLFEVHELALHRVREVVEGARRSIAGWFYR